MFKHFLVFLSLTCFLLFGTTKLNAQYNWDYGFTIGGASYLGDIGGQEDEAQAWLLDLKIEQTRLGLGVFARRKINDNFFVRADINYNRIAGADSLSTNPARVGRNLSFTNNIIGFDVKGEYVFLQNFDVGSTGSYSTNMSAYVGLGIGVLYHNPKAKLNGASIALQPLALEGVSYKLIQPRLPISLGIHYTFKRSYRVGFEVGYMFTLTDYLDDVSGSYIDTTGFTATQIALQSRPTNDDINDNLPHPNNYQFPSSRGNPDDDDGYLFANFTISKVLKGDYKNKKFNPHKRRYKYISSKKGKKRTKAKF